MSNNLLTDQHIAAEGLMILENELSFTKNVNRQYDKEYKGPAKRGATVYAKRPPRYTVRDGQVANPQDTTMTQVPVTLQHQFGVDVTFSSQDLALSVSEFGQDILQPQISVIANAIDFAGLQLALQCPNVVGTPGVTPGTGLNAQQTLQLYTGAGAVLDKFSCPRDNNRAVVIQEDAQAAVIPALAGLMNPGDDISKQYRDGVMGRAAGLKWNMSQNINVMTTGSFAGSPTLDGSITPLTVPTGTTLGPITPYQIATKGWTPNTVVCGMGDTFTIANTFGLNPVNYQNNGKLLQFVVINQTVTSDATGKALITVGTPIIFGNQSNGMPSPYRNVAALPAANAALAFFGPANTVTPQNLVFHKDFATFVCVDLPLPEGVHMRARKSDKRLGISMRFVAGYDIVNDKFIGRFDVLCGWNLLYPHWAVRIAG